MLLVQAETVSFLQGCDSRHEQIGLGCLEGHRGHGQRQPQVGPRSTSNRKIEKSGFSGYVLFNGPWIVHTTGCTSNLSCQPLELQSQF